jgi:peptidoglycan/LPS O-acetylase OafA/YrhL
MVLSWKPLATIGAASYSLYLLHQVIGVTAIGLIGQAIGGSMRPATVLIALAVANLMILISLAIYHWWEMPAKRFMVTGVRRAVDNVLLSSPRSNPLPGDDLA